MVAWLRVAKEAPIPSREQARHLLNVMDALPPIVHREGETREESRLISDAQ